MGSRPPVTGKIHVRRVAERSPAPGREDTHELVSVVAILSVPKGSFRNDGMYVAVGDPDMLALADSGETVDSRGKSHGWMMTEPIWRF